MPSENKDGHPRMWLRIPEHARARIERRAKAEKATMSATIAKYVQVGLSVTKPNQPLDTLPGAGE